MHELPCYIFMMWTLRVMNLLLAAYLGGLVASYLILLATPNAIASPTLIVYPFQFAAGILLLTLPGALWVGAIFRMAKNKWSVARSYCLAIFCGASMGGTVLLFLSPSSMSVFGVGAFFGFITASVWASLNLYVLRAF